MLTHYRARKGLSTGKEDPEGVPLRGDKPVVSSVEPRWKELHEEYIVGNGEGVDASWAEKAYEHTSAWWERIMKSFRQSGPASCVGKGPQFGVDHDTLQQFTASVIDKAAMEGKRVII